MSALFRQASVIGSPVKHSLSPSIFAYLSELTGDRDFHYSAVEENPASFLDRVKKDPSYVGFNITLPFKESVLPLLDSLSPEAAAIGAVNTVVIQNGITKGHNTDVEGILATFEANSVVLLNENILVLGAGGAARALAYALGSLKARKVVFVNSNLARAESLVAAMSPIFAHTAFRAISPSEYLHLQKVDPTPYFMIANTTPLGMMGKPKDLSGKSALDYFSPLIETSQAQVAFDLVYRPEKTPFLTLAGNAGIKPLGGLTMLIEQALAAYRLFNSNGNSNRSFNLNPSTGVALTNYLRARPIFLTGFMGSGKTTLGKALAEKLGKTFIDLDQKIQAETGLSVSTLFEEKGEKEFRRLEADALRKIAFSENTVISLGGGTLSHPEASEALATLVKKAGLTLFLDASPEILFKRIASQESKRPLLAGLSNEQKLNKISALLESRRHAYQKADLHLNTDSLTLDETLSALSEKLRTLL